MATCEAFIGRGKCGALPEPGQRYCTPHLRLFGSLRCAACHGWIAPGECVCPQGHVRPEAKGAGS